MSGDVAVDGGQTGLRIGRVDGSRIVDVVEAGGFSYRPVEDAVADDAGALVEAIRATGGPVGRVCLGLTNAPGSPGGRSRLARAVQAGLGAREVLVTSDMVTAHNGALGGADGVVVVAGTGAVCLGVAAGQHARGDGFGFLLGDEGSGFAVGRAGLRAALRAVEGRGPHTMLVEAMRTCYADVPDFPHGLYRRPSPVEDVAAFAPEVARAADAGDAVARSIWAHAVERLVAAVVSVVERCPALAGAQEVPVSYAGGLFAVADHLRRPFAEQLAGALPRATVVAPAGDPLAGAARLLAEGAARYGDLVSTTQGVVS